MGAGAFFWYMPMRIDPNDINDLKPLIRHVVTSMLDEIESRDARLGDRIAYSEAEAAGLLGVPRHVLRDARLRGEIAAKKIGKEYRYSRSALIAFVEAVQ